MAYIKKEDTIEAINKIIYYKTWSMNDKDVIEQIINCTEEMPTAEVEEVKHGKWRKKTKFIITDNPDDDGYWRTVYICSECEREEWRKEPYCHCGAKMDGDTVNEQ